jgi:hypothetical protein
MASRNGKPTAHPDASRSGPPVAHVPAALTERKGRAAIVLELVAVERTQRLSGPVTRGERCWGSTANRSDLAARQPGKVITQIARKTGMLATVRTNSRSIAPATEGDRTRLCWRRHAQARR